VKPRKKPGLTIRMRILTVLESATAPMSAKTIAKKAGADYKPTIDALNILMQHEKVQRQGKKCTSMWLIYPKRYEPRRQDIMLEEI